MKAKCKIVGDIIKSIFIITVVVLLAGQASAANTPAQKTTIEGMNLSYKLGAAHEKAIQGQNVTEFNNLVDIYNAWIRQHFGESADALLMSKITTTNLPLRIVQTQKQQVLAGSTVLMKTPFNASSDLSKFGKQRVRSPFTSPGFVNELENTIVTQKMKTF